MSYTLYRNNFQNCLELVVSSMLIRNNIPPYKIWNQAGLFFKELEEGWLLTPYYWSIKRYMIQNGIDYTEEYYKSVNDLISGLVNVVASGHSVGVLLDVFELPYSMYHQEYHDVHAIEIVQVQNHVFEIYDHYYHYHGHLEIEQLKKAINSYMDFYEKEKTHYFYIKAQNNKFIRKDEVILNNFSVMNGNHIKDLVEKASNGGYVGLSAAPYIKDTILQLLNYDKDEVEYSINDMFKDLKEISFSRQNYYDFLNKISTVKFASDVQEASQSWAVTANMILLANVSGDQKGMIPRIVKRIDRSFEHEMRVNEKIETYLKETLLI
ncbi:hypothetical protein ABE237_21475 [Brevibacillus formosus]|uniref:hypothetical protein n=1 Tax=Brevibacillus formosus TaxID=54913 RepID=UPI0018CF4D8E|nr:hypothetical protein [Brevibacillus formosus]MBG9941027.1 hypothetical protein [Brevibacillus formosus]